jgi:hypothetical protein
MINLIKLFDEIGVAIKFLDDGISTEGEMEIWCSPPYLLLHKLNATGY